MVADHAPVRNGRRWIKRREPSGSRLPELFPDKGGDLPRRPRTRLRVGGHLDEGLRVLGSLGQQHGGRGAGRHRRFGMGRHLRRQARPALVTELRRDRACQFVAGRIAAEVDAVRTASRSAACSCSRRTTNSPFSICTAAGIRPPACSPRRRSVFRRSRTGGPSRFELVQETDDEAAAVQPEILDTSDQRRISVDGGAAFPQLNVNRLVCARYGSGFLPFGRIVECPLKSAAIAERIGFRRRCRAA